MSNWWYSTMGSMPNISYREMEKRYVLSMRHLISVLFTSKGRSDPIFTDLVRLSSIWIFFEITYQNWSYLFFESVRIKHIILWCSSTATKAGMFFIMNLWIHLVVSKSVWIMAGSPTFHWYVISRCSHFRFLLLWEIVVDMSFCMDVLWNH